LTEFDTGGEVKNGAHSELEFVGFRARKSTSPPVSNVRTSPPEREKNR
jgi:hypothetical protein